MFQILVLGCLLHMVSGQCAHGAVYFRPTNRCFLLYQTPLVWEDALKYCRSLLGDLASIHSPEEQKFIHGMINNPHVPFPDFPCAWIGQNIKISNTTWTDGTPIDYKNYVDGLNPDDCVEEMDVCYYQDSVNWLNCLRCTHKLFSFCEVPVLPMPSGFVHVGPNKSAKKTTN